jgi:hypothetical protein
MAPPDTRPISLLELEQLLLTADPAALLVSPRVLRRVIRQDRRIPPLGFSVPHERCYVILRERLFDVVSRFELELDPSRELPNVVFLLRRPDEGELETRPAADVLFEYWRMLFHVRIHLELQRRAAAGQLTEDDVLDRLRRIGSPEYAEIRAVLQRDELLLPPRTDLSTYVEFAAVFLELRLFAPEQLPWYFPAIREPEGIAEILARDVDYRAVQDSTRLAGAERVVLTTDYEFHAPDQVEPIEVDPLRPSPPAYWRLIARAERAGSVGNVVTAAILRHKAARVALPHHQERMQSLATAELRRLVVRLQQALGFNDEAAKRWVAALIPVLQRSDQGFRTVESRLLYDLQKVCIEHERGVFTIDLFDWCRSWGKRPLRRPLPLLREVLVTKHLQSAALKVLTSRLAGAARERLSQLIDVAVTNSQRDLREHVRPIIAHAIADEGLRAGNVPEYVAFQKIGEELLDRMVRQGYLSFGNIRDTLSQNNLKLPDLTQLRELFAGDLLLRIDRRLAADLDGVYHHGPVYLRWSHRLSALAFGTQFGRFLTRYLALPFGGAFLILEGLRHIAHLFAHKAPAVPVADAAGQLPETIITPEASARPDVLGISQVLLLGIFLLMLLEHEPFRRWCLSVVLKLRQVARRLVYDLPVVTLRLPWVRRILDSPLYSVSVSYLLKPLAISYCVLFPFLHREDGLGWSARAVVFLFVNVLLNSPVGRFADEWVTDQFVRGLRGLHIYFIAAGFRLIMDLFQFLLQAVEQVLYAVDAWLLFRTGERRWVLAVKAVAGALWSAVNYIIRIYVTLLIEPQVNPIKHFPVVTVSHKIMLPFSIQLTRIVAAPLNPLGAFWANTIAGTTVFLLPGVFGFLVWELKENWRLYAANRSRNLQPIPIGDHGETMLRLLRLGFHSGTVPRVFSRLRRARYPAVGPASWKAAHKQREKLHHVEQSLRNFVARELVALLSECRQWGGAPLEIGRIRLASNQASLELRRPDLVHESLWLTFQERGGWLVASMPSRGWLDALPPEEREAFLWALSGLHKAAGVDMLWERVVEELGPPLFWYDIISDGILVWRDGRYQFAGLHKLRDTGATAALTMALRFVTEPSESAYDELMFSRKPIAWKDWLQMWPAREAACWVPPAPGR